MKLKKEDNNIDIKEGPKKDLNINAKKELLPFLKKVMNHTY